MANSKICCPVYMSPEITLSIDCKSGPTNGFYYSSTKSVSNFGLPSNARILAISQTSLNSWVGFSYLLRANGQNVNFTSITSTTLNITIKVFYTLI